MELLLHPDTKTKLNSLLQHGVYIVHGAKGVGKSTMIRELFGKNITGKIVPEGKSITIKQINELRRQLQLHSNVAEIYIIDDAEKMTIPAQNALLKTLEELPLYATVIMITHFVNSLLLTIQSRAQLVAIDQPQQPDYDNWLEQVTAGYAEVYQITASSTKRIPADVRQLIDDPGWLAQRSEQLETIANLFSNDRYISLLAATKLQSQLPDVLSYIIDYIRFNLRHNPNTLWAHHLSTVVDMIKFQAANVNKKLILDSFTVRQAK